MLDENLAFLPNFTTWARLARMGLSVWPTPFLYNLEFHLVPLRFLGSNTIQKALAMSSG